MTQYKDIIPDYKMREMEREKRFIMRAQLQMSRIIQSIDFPSDVLVSNCTRESHTRLIRTPHGVIKEIYSVEIDRN